MFRTIHAFLMIALLVPAAHSAENELRVLTYNIHHGEGTGGRIDLGRIAAVIRSVTPDLVALQEVDRKTERSGGVDQAAELAGLTGMQMLFGKTIDYAGGEYGNAILSKLPVERHANHPLPFTPGQEPRRVLEAVVEWPGAGGTVSFLATHLNHVRGPKDRLTAIPVIEKIAEAGARPAVLAGDLNATPDTEEMMRLTRLFAFADLGAPLFTTPVRNPERQIDYIAYYPRARWQTAGVRVLPEDTASDHRPLFAVLRLVGD